MAGKGPHLFSILTRGRRSHDGIQTAPPHGAYENLMIPSDSSSNAYRSEERNGNATRSKNGKRSRRVVRGRNGCSTVRSGLLRRGGGIVALTSGPSEPSKLPDLTARRASEHRGRPGCSPASPCSQRCWVPPFRRCRSNGCRLRLPRGFEEACRC